MPAFLSTLFTNPLLSAWHLLMFGVAIAGLGFLIAIHEMGHFLFAKLFGISTPTFSIGFGPQLISKKIGETTFSLSAIPLGGYVEIAGLAEVGQGEQGEAGRTDKRSFASKPYWQKMLVMLGGIGVNLGFAYVACIGLSFVQSPLVTPAQLHVAPASSSLSHYKTHWQKQTTNSPSFQLPAFLHHTRSTPSPGNRMGVGQQHYDKQWNFPPTSSKKHHQTTHSPSPSPVKIATDSAKDSSPILSISPVMNSYIPMKRCSASCR